MNAYNSKKNFTFFYLMGICIGIVIALMISFFLCNIKPEIDSGWLRGLWHGGNFVQNLILSFFDGRLLKAPVHSTAYNVFWWINCIGSCIIWLGTIISWIGNYRKKLDEF